MSRRKLSVWLCGSALAASLAVPAYADTLESALIQAYQNNPTLNSQRAAVRATDEGVPQALAGYRPRVVGDRLRSGQIYTDLTNRSPLGGPNTTIQDSFVASSLGLTTTQTLFNGFQTTNRTRQAESQVFAARETLRVTEQTVMLNAATAYMNLLRDTAILDLQRRNVEVLQEQLRQTRDRFNVGEVTRTDVAQSESRLAAGRSQVLTAEANQKTSAAIYRQVVGVNPGRLTAAQPGGPFLSGDPAPLQSMPEHRNIRTSSTPSTMSTSRPPR